MLRGEHCGQILPFEKVYERLKFMKLQRQANKQDGLAIRRRAAALIVI